MLIKDNYINKSKVYFVAFIHTIIIIINYISLPLLLINEPFWIWMPMLTFFVMPSLGGKNCIFNRLENFYREKAGMPKIVDRTNEIWKVFLKTELIQ